MSESPKSVAFKPASKRSGSEEGQPQIDERLAGILRERNLGGDCPRCGCNEWLVDRLAVPVLSLPVTDMQAARPDVPVLFLTCRNCGWIAMHSLKILEGEA